MDKMKNSQWIWQGLIASVVLVPVIVFGFITAKRDLTDFENLLLQFIFLSIGCGVSYWVGQESVKKAAREMISPHAKSAFRRLISLYRSLSRASSTIKSEPKSDTEDDLQMILAKLDTIITEQLDMADDALED